MTTNTDTDTDLDPLEITTYVPVTDRLLASGALALVDVRGRVLGIIPAADLDEYGAPDGPTCWTCDGYGHGHIIGWQRNGQPRLAGPCPVFGT